MTCTEEYKEHIEYTFHAFCVVVIRNAKYTALRDWSRKYKREISLEYLTEEKHHPLGTNDKCFQAPEPDEEYILNLCGDTVILNNGLLVQALSRLPVEEQEMQIWLPPQKIFYFRLHLPTTDGLRFCQTDKEKSSKSFSDLLLFAAAGDGGVFSCGLCRHSLKRNLKIAASSVCVM